MEEKNNLTEKLKVFGLVVESQGLAYLSIQYATSLEVAFALAKLEFEKSNPEQFGEKNPLIGGKISLFTSKTMENLINEGSVWIDKMLDYKKKAEKDIKNTLKAPPKDPTPQALPLPKKKVQLDPAEVKNMLMKVIIEKKDLEKLNKNKHLFTKNDIKYMKDKISKPKKDSSLDKLK